MLSYVTNGSDLSSRVAHMIDLYLLLFGGQDCPVCIEG